MTRGGVRGVGVTPNPQDHRGRTLHFPHDGMQVSEQYNAWQQLDARWQVDRPAGTTPPRPPAPLLGAVTNIKLNFTLIRREPIRNASS